MPQYDAVDIAQAVVDRMADAKDPRFKEVMTSLVKHMHAFAREVDLRPDEWMTAIQFLTATGQKCDEKRQEFILLSDTLGLSMLVVALDQARAAATLKAKTTPLKATEATVQGPFFWPGAPKLPLGADLAEKRDSTPTYYSGVVTDTSGTPVAGCEIDVWSGDDEGFYDLQKGEAAPMELRAQFRTDAQGRYYFWSLKPTLYPVPVDGPVGAMLTRMGRHPFRPGHMHFMLNAKGHQPLITHLFVSDSDYIESDAVFGVRDSLIIPFKPQPAGKAPDGRVLKQAWAHAEYDFRLVPQA
jgi:hydroxyquinol 1,2-dioxygenase